MTKPDGILEDASAASPWGTWEDLLLAFAVNRHGTNAWESVTSELHKRITVSPTPLICRNKYLDLRRRFPHEDAKSDAQIPALLLDELRKLRVAELRREVQRYDLNIESLELKMKKMEEERERSLEREKKAADLKQDDEEKTDAAPATTGEPVTGAELDKDQLSVNESNSTDPAGEKPGKGQKEPEPDRRAGDEDRTGGTSEEPSGLKAEPDQKSGREDSCNGSSNSIEKSERKAKAKSGQGGIGDSEAESGGEAATKENSDVQSSASRSRKEEGSDKVRRGNASGDAREHEDQSRAVKQLPTESQPLVGFLQAIRAHKIGSVFQRRLRSQESSKYQKVILQHVDLGIIEARVKEGFYSGATVKFFRDLLLLVNNAHVFFGKNSVEANAATEIRWLVSKEISQKQVKSDSSSGKHVSLQSLSLTKKEEPELSRSLLLKPLIVCRKRSSVAAKTSDKKKEQPDERDAIPQQSQSNTEEPKITKKRTRDSFPSVPTSTKKTGKNQYSNKNTNASESSKQQSDKGGSTSTSTSPPQQMENKKNPTSSESKKRGAANFLNRMKQGGGLSSNNSVLLDALKNTPLTSESTTSGKGGGGSEQKKTDNKKKEAVSKSKGKEKSSSPAKRNVGRPPKRGAVPSPATTGKQNLEDEETEAPAVKQPKKRQRKL